MNAEKGKAYWIFPFSTRKRKVKYSFLKDLADIINAGQSRTIAITGNINDLYHDGKEGNGGSSYCPLIEFLIKKWYAKERILIYTDNKGSIVFPNVDDKKKIDEIVL